MQIRPPPLKCVRSTAQFRSSRLHASLRANSILAHLRDELVSRPHNVIFDYMSPTPSHLLNISLSGILPISCYPSNFRSETLPILPAINTNSSSDAHQTAASSPLNTLPQGHHLVYFPPQIPTTELLPDGTDTLQYPGEPFKRRLWARGSVQFNRAPSSSLIIDGARAVCIEGIRDVTIKGLPGDEKIYVHIERRIGYVNGNLHERRLHLDQRISDAELEQKLWESDPDAIGNSAVLERRDLVFMRENAAKTKDIASSMRVIQVPATSKPSFSTSLTVPPALLFRFSALTFNAHAIHLDPQYSRDVEGYPKPLVHGPLTLTLMLSVLRSQVRQDEMITEFNYRNLAPLFADEEMRICVAQEGRDLSSRRYKVWIETPSGGYAVKGSATVANTA